MSLFGIHLAILNDEQHAIVKQALKDAGHELAQFPGSEADRLVAVVKAKFPDLVAKIEQGITDAKDTSLKGTDKLERVALDAVAAFPDALKALPQAKDFAIQLVQSVFVDGLAELEHVAAGLIGKL